MACNRCNDGYGGENKPWEKCGLLVCLIIVEILQMQLSSYSNYELDAPHNPSVLSVTLRGKNHVNIPRCTCSAIRIRIDRSRSRGDGRVCSAVT